MFLNSCRMYVGYSYFGMLYVKKSVERDNVFSSEITGMNGHVDELFNQFASLPLPKNPNQSCPKALLHS